MMLNRIQERLADIKKSKRVENQQVHHTSRSSPKSQPVSPATSTVAIDQSGSSNMDDFDEMKQIELGLIFKRSSFRANSEQKEYVRDFMNILSDDVSPSEYSKSQELTQDTASCKTPVREDLNKPQSKPDQKPPAKPQEARPSLGPDFKQRFNEVVTKAEAVLKQRQLIQKTRKSMAGDFPQE